MHIICVKRNISYFGVEMSDKILLEKKPTKIMDF